MTAPELVLRGVGRFLALDEPAFEVGIDDCLETVLCECRKDDEAEGVDGVAASPAAVGDSRDGDSEELLLALEPCLLISVELRRLLLLVLAFPGSSLELSAPIKRLPPLISPRALLEACCTGASLLKPLLAVANAVSAAGDVTEDGDGGCL